MSGLAPRLLPGAWGDVPFLQSSLPDGTLDEILLAAEIPARWDLTGFAFLAAASFFLVAFLFRQERKLIPVVPARVLLGLRGGLILLLLLAALSPAWDGVTTSTEPTQTLVAVDVSRSMDTVDQRATRLETLRLLESMGLYSSQESQTRLRGWISDIEAGTEPDWVPEEDESDPGTRAQQIRTRTETLTEQIKEISSLSRLETLRRVVERQWKTWGPQSPSRNGFHWIGFADKTAPIHPDLFRRPVDPEQFPFLRDQTRFSSLIQAVAQTGVPPQQIVLFSDGHDTITQDPAQLSQQFQELGIPIHTVLVGSEQPVRNLAILRVDHPQTLLVNDQPHLKTFIRTTGLDGETVRVVVESVLGDEFPPIERQITPTGPLTEVELTLPPRTAGRHRVRLTVQPDSEDSLIPPHHKEVSFDVVDQRTHVLMIDGESRWEFRFLNNMLARDPQIVLNSVLFQQPFLHLHPRPFFADQVEQHVTVPGSRSPFSNDALILIGDVSSEDLTEQHWQELDRYVREEGGTLVITAGRRNPISTVANPLLKELLPIQNPREIDLNGLNQTGPPETRGFRPSLTTDGAQQPMFHLDSDPQRIRQIWSELPGHLWGIVGELRGGATAWATVIPPGETPSLQAERRNTLIAHQLVGTGQVVWIGLDSTWRWRYQVGDLYHHRFWGQLVRWAAAFREHITPETFRLQLLPPIIQAGDSGQIQLHVPEAFRRQFPEFTAQAFLTRLDAGPLDSRAVQLTSHPETPERFEGRISGLPAGEFRVELQLTGAVPPPELSDAILVVQPQLNSEELDTQAHRGLLAEIARSTGGTFRSLHELSRLDPLLTGTAPSHTTTRNPFPAGAWLLLLAFLGLATLEWTLRKAHGLP